MQHRLSLLVAGVTSIACGCATSGKAPARDDSYRIRRDGLVSLIKKIDGEESQHAARQRIYVAFYGSGPPRYAFLSPLVAEGDCSAAGDGKCKYTIAITDTALRTTNYCTIAGVILSDDDDRPIINLYYAGWSSRSHWEILSSSKSIRDRNQ
jgi:hypothetical protein